MIDPVPLHRWEELLADRTGGCLPHEERRELEVLLRQHPEVDPYEFDEAAAAALLALAPPAAEEVPRSVRLRLQASADAWFAGLPATMDASGERPRGRLFASPWSGWAAAAALALVALGLWWARGPNSGPSPVEDRRELLARDDVGYWEFAPTDDPLAAGAGGDVVWLTEEQRGYLSFRGLPANDPAEGQYQLWIFDGAREEAVAGETVPPVDGGVFDVPANGEVVVPIDPKLRVGRPKLFAVTLEPPGGVVVSKQEHVLLVASTNT